MAVPKDLQCFLLDNSAVNHVEFRDALFKTPNFCQSHNTIVAKAPPIIYHDQVIKHISFYAPFTFSFQQEFF